MTKKGYKLTPAHKRKISEANRGRKLSEEVRQKISLRLIGNKCALGFNHSPEARAKISKARKGCIPWNKGIKAWNNGHRWSDTVRENISKGMILSWQRRKQQELLKQQ